ncbi:MAG: NAD(+) diphosphatase [Burkholderiaceae bacterium]
MLITTDDFLPDRQVALDDDIIVHAFIGDSLVLAADRPAPLPWRFFREAGFVPQRVHGLGRLGQQAHVAVSLSVSVRSDLPAGFIARGLRQWFGIIDERMLGIAMRAVQILEFDRTNQFCGGCGAPTVALDHERARTCNACRLTVYPRISPAMMVLIRDGRRLLLGRGVNFPPGRYSALAGFLEAGETIEQAIHREVAEEVSVRVKNLRYFASQSWPFPNSLMIAFTADYAEGDVRADPAELADARFFDVEDLPQLPPDLSIARLLIDSVITDIHEGR